MDIQSELIFVNGMVHLPHEWTSHNREAKVEKGTSNTTVATEKGETLHAQTW